ncbi:MAG: hypothetical protein IPF52_16635 [Saprospiraceae bacterium]|nr:hypothetical protein [Saprospiraceae bacterium]
MKSNFIKFLAMLVLPMFVASCNKDDTPSNKIPDYFRYSGESRVYCPAEQ